ncbi:hypothetical protein IWW36_001029 [Coemansia brasiliensis]|uniref:DASH complex subunit ASK1 n=1 Tax=Coemansia brasiliensis TaxID=2650707 RepID=A0A9W8LZF8_9FUNG|nr:hypothetical protein IWW36_001029 [Coemansia brasiliensis]
MANFARAMQLSRPDSRSSQYSMGGRFSSALSAAVKQQQQQQQQQHSTPSASAEEQLEEVEQKITLTLQAIDANFDHCQRTMARDVMPKVETLARLSNDLLQASQPWLQFFMAVASADDNEEPNIPSASKMSTEQRHELEEQAAKGDITARFPESPMREANDETESIDLDAEIATPQLTSRFMTQELKMSTPRVGSKRMAEQLSTSIRKRARGGGTPLKQQLSGSSHTPASMMRALVHARASKHPGSAVSAISKDSSVGTSDLMPETSPPHTTTFTLPKSRHRIVGTAPKTASILPEDEDDDDILDEINTLIRRYDSPKGTRSSVKSSMRSIRSMQSVARSDGSYSQEMTQLAEKYASPAQDAASSAQKMKRVQGLVADMEEMLDEAEASAAAAAEAMQQENTTAQSENEDDDEIPSPPKITSDLEQSRVTLDTCERVHTDDISEARGHNMRRNFAAHQPMAMDVEAMDSENMTIGHMSPLALRQRQQQQQRATMGARFSSLQESDEDDPFGPTPARPSAQNGAQGPWANVSSARSLQERGWTDRAPESTTRSVQEASWTSGGLGERSSTFDATATFGSPESDLDPHTRDSRLNASASLVPIDGTTTILPTREMLRQAAEASEAILEDDDDGGELIAFDAELFPPAFQEAPAAQQLRALYDLMYGERERLWKLEDLVGAELESLVGVQPSVYGVLLDLLARRRMLRQVADNLWTAH